MRAENHNEDRFSVHRPVTETPPSEPEQKPNKDEEDVISGEIQDPGTELMRQLKKIEQRFSRNAVAQALFADAETLDLKERVDWMLDVINEKRRSQQDELSPDEDLALSDLANALRELL